MFESWRERRSPSSLTAFGGVRRGSGVALNLIRGTVITKLWTTCSASEQLAKWLDGGYDNSPGASTPPESAPAPRLQTTRQRRRGWIETLLRRVQFQLCTASTTAAPSDVLSHLPPPDKLPSARKVPLARRLRPQQPFENSPSRTAGSPTTVRMSCLEHQSFCASPRDKGSHGPAAPHTRPRCAGAFVAP